MVRNFLLTLATLTALSTAYAQTPEASSAAPEAASAVAGKAAEGSASVGEKASSFLDSLSNSIKNFGEDTSKEVSKYSQELKEKWPGLKDQINEKWQQGLQQGDKAKSSFNEWMNNTFSKERMDKAEAWIDNFKAGTEEKVIDPLVPFLLTLRYPNPLNEWQAGYRRTQSVKVQGLDNPVELQLPISWDISQDMNVDGRYLMTWKNESGTGPYSISLISTPAGATVDSIAAGLEKERAGTKAQKLQGSDIQMVRYPATADVPDAVTYFIVPLKEKTILLAAEVMNKKKTTPEEINKVMSEREPFFELVAKSVFVNP